MNETQSDKGRRAPRIGSRKVRLAIAAAALLGLGTSIGVVATYCPVYIASHAWKGWRHHGHSMTEAEVREHAKRFSARILGKVDATEAQRGQVDEVLDAFVAKAWPLREEHREHRQALLAELTGPEVRREVLEEIRAQELALADTLSGELVEALVAVSGILDADQRAALAEHVTRHRHHRHHHDH